MIVIEAEGRLGGLHIAVMSVINPHTILDDSNMDPDLLLTTPPTDWQHSSLSLNAFPPICIRYFVSNLLLYKPNLSVCLSVLCSLCTAIIDSSSWADLREIWHVASLYPIPYRWSWGLASGARARELTLRAPSIYVAANGWRHWSGHSELAASNGNGSSAVGARVER